MPQIICKMIDVCVFKFEFDKPIYLLLKRRNNEKYYPGIWQFVSGSLENDESAVDGALRELKEETRLNPKMFWVVPHVNSFYDPEYDAINIYPLFVAQVNPGENPILSNEHSEYNWFTYEDAVKNLVWPSQRLGLNIIHDYIVKGDTASKFILIKQ